MALIGNLITAAVSRLIGEEIMTWSPKLCRTLVKLAVNWLPEKQRARFGEEWQSHVNEVPGNIGKFVVVAGFLLAALKIRKIAPRVDRVDQWMQTVSRLRVSNSQSDSYD